MVDAQTVWRALGALSERQRAVVVLRYYADLSEAEIAETLGIAPGTVKAHAHAALAALGATLASCGSARARPGGGGDMSTERLVREALEDSVKDLPCPEPDLEQLVAAGRAMRRRRVGVVAGLAAAAVLVLVLAGLSFAWAGGSGRALEPVPANPTTAMIGAPPSELQPVDRRPPRRRAAGHPVLARRGPVRERRADPGPVQTREHRGRRWHGPRGGNERSQASRDGRSFEATGSNRSRRRPALTSWS